MFFSVTIYVLAVAAVASAQEECAFIRCDRSHMHYYAERQCVPVMTEGECCPTSYTCPPVNTDDTKCHVKGQSYDIGTTISSEQVGDKCVAECRCMEDPGDSAKAHLECVRIECPEHLGVQPPEGCSFTYTHDKCCHTGTTCDNATDTTRFTCQHGDHAHTVGEKFHPDDHPCHECICMEGFDGTVKEPWCKEINCGMQQKQHEGCSPVYLPGRCCPIEWHCPKEMESLGMLVSSVSPQPPGGPQCVFGRHSVAVEGRLTWEGSCVECKCSMPPHLMCKRKEGC